LPEFTVSEMLDGNNLHFQQSVLARISINGKNMLWLVNGVRKNVASSTGDYQNGIFIFSYFQSFKIKDWIFPGTVKHDSVYIHVSMYEPIVQLSDQGKAVENKSNDLADDEHFVIQIRLKIL